MGEEEITVLAASSLEIQVDGRSETRNKSWLKEENHLDFK